MESGDFNNTNKDAEVSRLKDKLDQLNKELEKTTSEKIQSAQYGLVLLVSFVVRVDCFLLIVIVGKLGREGGIDEEVQ